MKIRKLEEWSIKELLICGAILIFIGFILLMGFTHLGFLRKKEGITENLIGFLCIITMFTGLVFLVAAVGKFVKKKQEESKRIFDKEGTEIIFSKEQTEIRNVKEFIFVLLIPLLILLFVVYWFEIRPRRIELKCFREAVNTEIDIFSNSSGKNAIEKKYQECLKKYNLEK